MILNFLNFIINNEVKLRIARFNCLQLFNEIYIFHE